MSIEKYLLRFYPHHWRERYEDELLAMLEQRSLTFVDGVNLFFGALDAQLHPHLGTASMSLYERIGYMLTTLRRSVLTIFCAYVGFILAGWGFQKLTEYADFQEVAQTHGIVNLSFHLVVLGAVVALLAVLAGGLPIVIAVIKSAFERRQHGTLFLLAVPILAFVIFLGVTLFLEAIDRSASRMVWQPFLYRGLFFGSLLAAAIVSPVAVCFAVVRSEIPEKILRFALRSSILVTISMALISASTIIWGLGLQDGAPQLFSGNDGLVSTSTMGTWLSIVIAMGIATVLAAVALIRGLSARSALLNTAKAIQ